MPIEATKHTAAGAKAFAEFFIRTIDWGYATVSGAYLRHYSAPSCTTCKSLITTMDADRRAGHRYIGGRSTIVRTQVGPRGPLATQVVVADSTAFESVSRTGKFISGDRAYDDQRFDVDLRWTVRGWIVDELAVEQS